MLSVFFCMPNEVSNTEKVYKQAKGDEVTHE